VKKNTRKIPNLFIPETPIKSNIQKQAFVFLKKEYIQSKRRWGETLCRSTSCLCCARRHRRLHLASYPPTHLPPQIQGNWIEGLLGEEGVNITGMEAENAGGWTAFLPLLSWRSLSHSVQWRQ